MFLLQGDWSLGQGLPQEAARASTSLVHVSTARRLVTWPRTAPRSSSRRRRARTRPARSTDRETTAPVRGWSPPRPSRSTWSMTRGADPAAGGAAASARVSASRPWFRLRTLNLFHSDLGGALAAAARGARPAPEPFNVKYDSIGVAGARALASRPWPLLRRLNLPTSSAAPGCPRSRSASFRRSTSWASAATALAPRARPRRCGGRPSWRTFAFNPPAQTKCEFTKERRNSAGTASRRAAAKGTETARGGGGRRRQAAAGYAARLPRAARSAPSAAMRGQKARATDA
jgi:hypothetical protein